MKLSKIRATLKDIGVSPSKALGQNFLHDQNLARWIVDQAQITPQDYVVEIGPGLGALTRFILEKGAHVLAIEKADVLRAGEIVQNRALLSARDSVHIAVMERHGIQSILSFDGDFDRWPGIKRIHSI